MFDRPIRQQSDLWVPGYVGTDRARFVDMFEQRLRNSSQLTSIALGGDRDGRIQPTDEGGGGPDQSGDLRFTSLPRCQAIAPDILQRCRHPRLASLLERHPFGTERMR